MRQIRGQPNLDDPDEIEIDIDKIDDATLRYLEVFVRDALAKKKKHKAIKTAAKRKAFKEWHWGVNAENIFGAFIHTAMHEGCLHAVKKCGAALTLCTIIQVHMYM